MKLVITSDWHADWSTSGVDRHEEIRDAAERIVSRVEPGDAFLMLGDLTDPDTVRSHRAVAMAVRLAELIRGRSATAIFIAGNHDTCEDGAGTTVLAPLAPIARVFETPGYVLAWPFLVVALPYPSRATTYDPVEFVEALYADKEFLARKKGAHVVVAGHLTIPGIIPGSETEDMPRGGNRAFPRDVILEREPGALLLNGHYHRAQDCGGILIPGSIARLTHGEETHRPGWMEIEIRGEGRLEVPIVTRHSLPKSRPLATMRGPEVWKRVLAEGVTWGAGEIVRVEPPAGAPPEEVDRVMAALRDAECIPRLMPTARVERLAVAASEEGPVGANRSHREVVMEMVEQAAGERGLLRAEAENIMAEVGL
jgi:DNA repair exonuclease SbcCD nuclease subunit